MARVLVPLAQGCEELEAITIIDLLRRANIEVISASLDDLVITASRGCRLVADTLLESAYDQAFDMVVLPGGLPGAEHLDHDPRIHQLIARLAQEGKYIAAICAAPRVLANAGLLDRRRATCFPGVLTAAQYPAIKLTDQPVVIDEHIITSRGPGTAMDFALTLIELLSGTESRERVEGGLQRPSV